MRPRSPAALRVLVIAAAGASACARMPPVSYAGADTVFEAAPEQTAGCTFLGTVEGRDVTVLADPLVSRAQLAGQAAAARRNANRVVWYSHSRSTREVSVLGRAYACPAISDDAPALTRGGGATE